MADFHTWRRFGRSVRRGERAVWILAPVTRRVADKAVHAVVAFRPVAVFAEDQTEGEPLPEICKRLCGDEPLGAYAGLIQVAQSLGFTVEDHAFDDETNGDCSHALRRIRIRVHLEPAQRAKTLAHELAHAVLHVDRSERSVMELEAESVAFVVCDVLGVDAGEWSFGYVAVWSGGGDEAIAAIKAAGRRIQHTAEHILLALNLGDGGATEPPRDDET